MRDHIEFTFLGKSFVFRVRYVLAALVIIGAFVRFFDLTYTGLWLDEIYSMTGSNPASGLSEVYRYSVADQPPLYFIALNIWLKLFGFTDFAARSLSCVYGLLGIISIYFLGKEIKDHETGLLSAFFTTLSWNHVAFSMEARFYALVFLLSTLSYLFFLRSLKGSRVIDFSLYVFFSSLLLNTHYFGMVVFVTQLIIFLVTLAYYRPKNKLIIGGLISGAVTLSTLIHWFPVISHDLEIPSHYVKPHTLRYLLKFTWWLVYDPLAFVVFIVCIYLAFRIFINRLFQKHLTLEQVVLFSWFFIGFAIPLAYSFLRMPLFTVKYCTIQIPALFVIVSVGFGQIKVSWARSVILILLLLSAIIVLLFARPPFKKSWHEDGREFLIMYFTGNEADKKSWNEDWREVAKFFKAEKQQSKEVVFSQLSWFHEYYFKKNDLSPPYDQNVCDFKSVIAGADRVWLILHDHYTGGWPTNGFSETQKELIRKEFELKDVKRFARSKAFLYQRKSQAHS